MPRHEYDRWQADLEARRREEAERRAREAQERAERARREREGEERRLAEIRKFSEDREQCRRLRIVAVCDAALQSPHATHQDRADLSGWRESGVEFASNLARCRRHVVAACDAALASPAATDQTRTLLLRWRAEASPLQRALAWLTGAWDYSRTWVRDRVRTIADLPASTLVAGGIALALAVALAAVLLVSRRSPWPPPAAPTPPDPGVPAQNERSAEPAAAAGESHDAVVAKQPEAQPAEPRSFAMSETQLATRPGAQRMNITGLSIHGNYGTARGIAGIISFLGWLLVAAGAFAAIPGLGATAQTPFGGFVLVIGLGIAAVGILQVAAGQMLRASVDSADYARQALLLQVGIAEGRSEIDLQGAPAEPVRSGPSHVPGGLARVPGR